MSSKVTETVTTTTTESEKGLLAQAGEKMVDLKDKAVVKGKELKEKGGEKITQAREKGK